MIQAGVGGLHWHFMGWGTNILQPNERFLPITPEGPVLSKYEPCFVCVCVCVCVFWLYRAAPSAYGGGQARDLIGATAAGLHHSHSKAGSEPNLQPTPQLTATLNP